jgi:hypothetical protein
MDCKLTKFVRDIRKPTVGAAMKCCRFALLHVVALTWTAVASGEDPVDDFFPSSFVLDTTESSTSKRFQYHVLAIHRQPKGKPLVRRIVVERDGPRHAIAILSGDGFVLAHHVDNVLMCMSPDAPDRVTIYAGLGFRAWLGIDKSGDPGVSFDSVIPADGSFSRCDVGAMLAFFRSRATTLDLVPGAGVLSMRSAAGNVALVDRAAQAEPAASNGVRSVLLAWPEGMLGVYGFDFSHEPRMTICGASAKAREAGELNGRFVQLTLKDDSPAELNELCLAIDDADPRRRETADRFQRRFQRDALGAAALAHRDELLRLHANYRDSAESTAAAPFLTGVAGVFEQIAEAPKPLRKTGNETGAVPQRDPYVLSWHAEADFGPLVATHLRRSLMTICGDDKQDAAQRVQAFGLLCRLGWTPTQDAELLTLERVVRPLDASAVEKHLATVAWELTKARMAGHERLDVVEAAPSESGSPK